MITFKEFLLERASVSKKTQLIKDDTITNIINTQNLSALRELEETEELLNYDLNDKFFHIIMFKRLNNKSHSLIQIAEILLRNGAFVDATTKDSETALMWATDAGDKEFIELLIKYKADPTLKNIYGNSACSIARGSEIKALLGCK
jgi:ankyrin repeat protein